MVAYKIRHVLVPTDATTVKELRDCQRHTAIDTPTHTPTHTYTHIPAHTHTHTHLHIHRSLTERGEQLLLFLSSSLCADNTHCRLPLQLTSVQRLCWLWLRRGPVGTAHSLPSSRPVSPHHIAQHNTSHHSNSLFLCHVATTHSLTHPLLHSTRSPTVCLCLCVCVCSVCVCWLLC